MDSYKYKIDNKYQKAKIKKSKVEVKTLKNIILGNQDKVAKIRKIHIHEICFKNGVFFCKVIVGFKNEN